MFVKMAVDAPRSGLIAEMGPPLWSVLCVIAAHMDGDGRCYPSQAVIGRALGVNRQTANRYVGQLLAFRWRGEPVLSAEKERGEGGKFDRTRYTVLPASGLTMF